MKHILFAFTVSFGFVFIAVHPQHVVAQEVEEVVEATESAQAQEENIQYTLPYPGILPDHPLYFLKSIRDTIIGVLISDPYKKAEFNLLNADKQIASVPPLLEKGKVNEARETVTKAETYMREAVNELEQVKSQEKDVGGLAGRIETAGEKHSQVLEASALSESQAVEGYIKTLQNLQEELQELRN